MTRGRPDTWSPAELAGARRDYEAGVREPVIAERYGKTKGQIRGKAIHQNWHKPATGRARELRNTRALIERRTVFPGQVRLVHLAKAIFVRGADERKLGPYVTKGAWAGWPIFSLTLEERATCPQTCHHWSTCYGNTSQWAVRLKHGPALETALDAELARLQDRHPAGFVIRLHLLGDFYSLEYVRRWARWLNEFPALHIFGYTAHPPSTPIGRRIHSLARLRWDRFAIRWSTVDAGPGRAITLWADDGFAALDSDKWIIPCPQQDGATDSCGSCALCWSPEARDATIAFTAHGGR